MSTIASYPVCSTYGDRIGVYEPVWLQLENGSLTVSAPLQLDWHRSEPRLLHLGCLEVEG